MNYFIVSQIDENGNETGLVKMIKGHKETAKFIVSEEENEDRRNSISSSIEKMNPGDFDAISSGKFIYEIDCLSEEDANKVDVDEDNLITEEKTAVYEIFYEEKNIKYAFGADDLKKKLKESGIELDELPKDGEEKPYETNDPVHVSVTVKKLDEREVEKLKKTSDAFMIDYEIATKSKVDESSDEEVVKTFEQNGFKIKIIKLYNGKFAYSISHTKTGRFVSMGSFFQTAEKAEEHAVAMLDDETFKKSIEMMKLDESTENGCEKLCKYCGHDIEIYNSDDAIQCKITKNGQKIKNFKNFGSIDEAVNYGKSFIDFGINESSDDMVEIVLDLDIARKAGEALNDNPYIKGNINWTSSNSFVFSIDEDDEDDTLLDEIKEQLESWGISEDQYMIQNPEEI